MCWVGVMLFSNPILFFLKNIFYPLVHQMVQPINIYIEYSLHITPPLLLQSPVETITLIALKVRENRQAISNPCHLFLAYLSCPSFLIIDGGVYI